MAFASIASIAPNYRDFKNDWLKAYEPGTTTPKVMALDSEGATLVIKVQLNADGFIESAGGAIVTPYIDGHYDMWLFPTEPEADANDTTNAVRVADNLDASRDGSGNVFISVKEEQTLSSGQTTVNLAYSDALNGKLYIASEGVDRGRLIVDVDYTVTSSGVINIIELIRSFPAGAILTVDSVVLVSSGLVDDLSQAYEFATVAAYKAFSLEFPIGKIINLLDRGASFTVIDGIGAATGFGIISSDQVSQSIQISEQMPTFVQWGGVHSTDSTLAFIDYKDNNYNLLIDEVDGPDQAFIIDGNIQLRDGQKITALGGDSGILTLGAASFIKFAENASFLTGSSSRLQIHVEGIYFIGKDGQNVQGVVGSGIAFDGQMGGRIDRCRFNGLEAAVVNPVSFFITYSDIDIRYCDRGLDLDDSNACVIEKVQCSVTRRPIKGGSDSARLVLRDVSVNMNSNCEIAIDVNGGIVFDGYTYIEVFSQVDAPANTTAIRYSSTQFSQRTLYMGNILIDSNIANIDYGLVLDSINNVATDISGIIENVKFAGAYNIAKVGYGIHDSSFPTLFVGIDINSCEELNVTDVVGNQPIDRARIPVTSTRLSATTAVSGASYIVIPLDTVIIYDNVDAFSAVADKYRVRQTGYYEIECVLVGDNVLMQSRIEIDGIGQFDPVASNPVLRWSGILTAAQTVEVTARNGTNVTDGTFTIKYISQGE